MQTPKTSIFLIAILLIDFVLFNFKIYGQVQKLDWPIEIVSEGHGFTEGPALAPDGKIYFTDMDKGYILNYSPSLDTTNIWHDQSRMANGLLIHKNHLYSCEAVSGAVVKYKLSKGTTSREVLVSTFMGDSLGSPNDLTIIEDKLYFSEFWLEMYLAETERKREIFNNRVYKLSLNNNALDSIPFSFSLPNGVTSSPDGKDLFIADWSADKLYKVELEEGVVGKMELLTDLEEYNFKGPDGMAVNNDGFLFVALYGKGNVVLVINPEGNVMGYLPTGPLTSNCVFAADDKTLYITANKKLMRVVVPEMIK